LRCWARSATAPPPASAASSAATRPGFGAQAAELLLDLGPDLVLDQVGGASGVASRSVGRDRRGERDLDADRAGEEAGEEEPLGAADRARDDRRSRLDRQPAGAAARRAQLVRVAVAGALGEQREHAAVAQHHARGLERLGSASPRLTGNAPSIDSSRADLPSNSSFLAMKRTSRGVASATKKLS
jgi:hypothetical protein